MREGARKAWSRNGYEACDAQRGKPKAWFKVWVTQIPRKSSGLRFQGVGSSVWDSGFRAWAWGSGV